MKKSLALLLAIAMLLALTACGGSGSSAPAADAPAEAAAPAAAADPNVPEAGAAETAGAADENGIIYYLDFNGMADMSRKSTLNSDERYGTVTIAQFAAPTELQPINHLDMGKGTVINEVYEKLLQKSGDEYLPLLAKSWEQIDDTTYQFTLYDYIHDTDGNNITASDVVFSYNLEKEGGFARNFQLFDSAEAVDTYVVQINLNAPIDDLVSFEAIFSLVDIVSEKAYGEHDFNSDPVATGPYKVESFVTGNNITLVVNEDYWQTDESVLLPSQRRTCERISIDIIGDATMRLYALEDGTNMFCDLNSETMGDFLSGGKYEGQYNLIRKDDSTLYSLVANITANSPMSDPNLRMAVWYAIDSAQYVIAQGELLNDAANCSSIPAYGDWQADWASWTNYMTDYDLAMSKQYLDASSYNGQSINILYEDMPGKMAIAEILQLQLEAAGIKGELGLLAHPLYMEALSNPTGFDIAVLSGGTADKTVSRANDFYGPNGYVGALYAGDTTLTDMIAECATLHGYSAEKTAQIMQYLIDNGYEYTCTYGSKLTAYSPDYAGLYFLDGDGDLFPGACDYYLD